jgi:CheY-like chemotaxis protein
MPNPNNLNSLHLPKKSVLLVEDSEEDYEMFIRVVKKTDLQFELNRCETGEDAIIFLKHQSIYQDKEKFQKPSLILLDLNLPGIDGKKVLEEIKLDANLQLIPVVIFSTSSNPKDIEECYQKGANGYVIKPMDISLLQEYIQILLLHWLKINIPYVYQ